MNLDAYNRIKRSFDIFMAVVLLLFLFAPCLIIAISIKLSSAGPVIFWSVRVGRRGEKFKMPKFRTMQETTPVIATHLLGDASSFLTPLGSFLRKTSLDELPQLWSILIGDMSFVGPRPALFNQHDLIALRSKYRIDRLRPGLTGWAQINGRDDLSIPIKVFYDLEYAKKQSFLFDAKIIVLTFSRVISRNGVAH